MIPALGFILVALALVWGLGAVAPICPACFKKGCSGFCEKSREIMTGSTANTYVLKPMTNVVEKPISIPKEVELGADFFTKLRELPGGPPDVPEKEDEKL